jgi:hypothetical protein
MSSITVRSTGHTHGSGGAFTQLSSYAHRIADHWRQWKAERELESMPFDIRKDIGWPSTDIEENYKRMQ